MSVKIKKDETETTKKDTVSLVSLFVLIHRTCASFLEKKTTPEDFYACMDGFVKHKLHNSLHKSMFTFTLARFKKMSFEKVKQECLEIPQKIAEKDHATYRLLVGYEISHMTH